jgi:hypothetical protein
MTDFKLLYQQWDEFLRVWPLQRLATMTLDDYTKAGSKDSFTYWLEARLDGLGSIWGGSAFKFGIFSRKDREARDSDTRLSYSATHGWYSALGQSAEAAFEQIRSRVVQVATCAARGDLEGVDAVDLLGQTYRWKIAFHYQDRRSPCIVGIFKRAPLSAFAGSRAGGRSMAALQQAAMNLRPPEMGVLEFGRQIWGEWTDKNLAVWKLSHGDKDFAESERQQLKELSVGVMHGSTGAGQGEQFREVPVGTLFYLCHGNSPQRLGQFTTPAAPSSKGNGWLQRSYRVLADALRSDPYQDNSKKWSPRGNSTFWPVTARDLPEFERTLLGPYFGTSLAELAGLAGEPLPVTSPAEAGAEPASDEALLSHFDGKPPFRAFRSSWSDHERSLFCRLARAVHDAGLDWWHIDRDVEVRFGRKQPGNQKAASVLGIIHGTRPLRIFWRRSIGDLQPLRRVPLTDDVVARFEAALSTAGESAFEDWPPQPAGRRGLWPDELHVEPGGLRQPPGPIGGPEDDEADDEADKGASTPVPRLTPINRIYYGPPGTGKTHELRRLLKRDYEEPAGPAPDPAGRRPSSPALQADLPAHGAGRRHTFVTFHQSYGYEEFVEGLRPVLNGNGASGQVHYEIRSGAFKDLCQRARRAPHQRFAILIDEINRGNISKIFGELITLIEPDKREGAEHAVAVRLPYSGELFSVPPNVDIIGTMNTADRSLALLDTALRRRFEFEPLLPDARSVEGAPLSGLRVVSGGTLIEMAPLLAAMNERIEALYDRDHCIGHAYFMPLWEYGNEEDRFAALAGIFRNRVLPLLEEYFFDDWRKIELVLADNQKAMPARFIVAADDHGAQLDRLFGREHGLETGGAQLRYTAQDKAFWLPEAYVGIYETLA